MTPHSVGRCRTATEGTAAVGGTFLLHGVLNAVNMYVFSEEVILGDFYYANLVVSNSSERSLAYFVTFFIALKTISSSTLSRM